MDMRITVLCNDKAIEGFECEHGVSFFVEMNGKNYLFDTGSTDVAVKNARKLGLNLSRIELIVISHGHYDHLGGLGSALRETGAKKVLVGEGSFERKFSETTLTSPEDGRTEYERLGAIIETVWTSKEIADGVYVMTAAPLVTKERPGQKRCSGTVQVQDLR